MFTYQIYGLTLGTNQPLDGLTPAPAGVPIDVTITLLEEDLAAMPLGEHLAWDLAYTATEENGVGVNLWRITQDDGRYMRVRYTSDTWIECLIDPPGSQLWLAWAAPRENMIAILISSILPGLLRQRRVTCLHAGVVAIDGQAIALLGHKGAGKSTTVAALTQAGATILADDIAVLVEQAGDFWVHPGTARLRLTAQAVAAMGGSTRSLSPVFRPNRYLVEKQYFDPSADGQPGTQQRTPLRAVYLLAARSATLVRPQITALQGITALTALMQQTSVSFMLDQTQRAADFAVLGRLVARIPVRQIERPDDLARLSDLCTLIAADIQHLSNKFPQATAQGASVQKEAQNDIITCRPAASGRIRVTTCTCNYRHVRAAPTNGAMATTDCGRRL